MKKLIILAAITTAILGTITIASATDTTSSQNNRGCQGYCYEDNDNNGICDNYENQTYDCTGRQHGNRGGRHHQSGRYGK